MPEQLIPLMHKPLTKGFFMSLENNIRALFVRETVRKWEAKPEELPWFDRPEALDLLEARRRRKSLSDADYELLRQYATEGYCVVSGMLREEDIDSMNRDFDHFWTVTEPLDGFMFYDVRLGVDDALISMSHAELLKVDLERRLRARNIPDWRLTISTLIPQLSANEFQDGEPTDHPRLSGLRRRALSQV